MLKLKNIKLIDNILSADYYPENSDDYGHVACDVITKEIVYTKQSNYDEDFPMYLSHAIDAIKLLIGREIPSEKLIMWY